MLNSSPLWYHDAIVSPSICHPERSEGSLVLCWLANLDAKPAATTEILHFVQNDRPDVRNDQDQSALSRTPFASPLFDKPALLLQ
jgi:hypothetical protein